MTFQVAIIRDELASTVHEKMRHTRFEKAVRHNGHSFGIEFSSANNAQTAQIQTWPTSSKSDLHVHGEKCDWDDGRENTGFNSLIYLNDDFEGGEFFTENIMIKPKTGTLTLFDGSTIYHGVKPILKGERYTIILWWKK